MTGLIILRLPADTLLPVPVGRWKRLADGAIEACFTRLELCWALACIGHPAGLEGLREERC